MTRERFDAWVMAYRRAWESNATSDIESLFTPDALYYASPHSTPWEGRDQIVSEWLGARDEPGTTEFTYEIVATDGDVGIVRGVTDYLQTDLHYDNLWEISLDNEGRCTRFVEWWIEIPKK